MIGLAIVAVAFIVVGIPVLSVIGLRGYWMWLRDKQVQGLLEERKLLIEKGATDLPPLELPQMAWETKAAEVPPGQPPAMPQPLPLVAKSTVRSAIRWAGVILLIVAAFLLVLGVQGRGAAVNEVLAYSIVLGLIGLLLLLIPGIFPALGGRAYAVAGAYEREEGEGPEPTAIGQPLPVMAKSGVRSAMLCGGFVLLCVGAYFFAWYLVVGVQSTPPAEDVGIVGLILSGIGLLLLLANAIAAAVGGRVYAVAGAYEGGERQALRPLDIARVRDPLRNLKASITLVFLAAAFVSWEFLTPALISGFRPQLQIAVILGGVGLALLVIHFTEAYYAHREGQEDDEEQDAPA